MRDRLGRLKIKHQLAIAGSVLAIPLVALVGRDIVGHMDRIEAARTEIRGLGELAPYRGLLRALPRHRALVQIRLGGDASVDPGIAALVTEIDGLVAEAGSAAGGSSSETPLPVDLQPRWDALKSGWRGRSNMDVASDHAVLMDSVAADMEGLANRSGLLPSRSTEAYRLAQLVVRRVPALIRSLDEVVASGQARLEDPASGNTGMTLSRRLFSLDLADTRLRETLRSTALAGSSGELDDALRRLAATVSALADIRDTPPTEQDFVDLGEQALDKAVIIHDAATDALRRHLSERVSDLEAARNAEIAALVLALALITLLLAIVGRNITRPIRRVVDMCRQLGAGRYDQDFDRNVGGDMGVVINALGDLQRELAREKHTRQQAERDREGLRDRFVQAQKMEALGTLAGGIAHDFNNVIAAIIGQAELAQFASQSGKPVQDRLERVVKAGLRAKPVVQQILSFARPDASVESEPVRPSQMLRETVTLVETGLQEPIAIDTKIDDGVGPIMINPSQCHQLLLNVLVNAGHAVGNSGARVECGVRAVEGPAAADGPFTAAPGDDAPPRHDLWLSGLGEGRYANFWVADGGSGMARDVLARIFDPFFTTRTDGQGSGLGLSAAQGIVHAAGGAMHVGTTPGVGSRFGVFLPLCTEAAEPEPLANEGTVPPAGHGLVLLVDDNDDALEALAAALRSMGYSVDVHAGSDTALAAFRTTEPTCGIVVTDHNMSGLTGIDLIAEIRAERPDLPAILTSGRIDPALRARAHDAGIDDFLEKPFRAEQLAAAIRRVLDRDAGQREPQ